VPAKAKVPASQPKAKEIKRKKAGGRGAKKKPRLKGTEEHDDD